MGTSRRINQRRRISRSNSPPLTSLTEEEREGVQNMQRIAGERPDVGLATLPDTARQPEPLLLLFCWEPIRFK